MEQKVNQEEKKAIELTIELWEWLARTGTLKPTWTKWVGNGGEYVKPRFACFLCEFANITLFDELGGSKCKTICPYGKKYGFCAENGSPYSKWEEAPEGSPDKKAHAEEFLAQLKTLLPPKPKFPIGSKLRNIGEGNDHRGQIGVLTKVDGEQYWLKYADGQEKYTNRDSDYELVALEVGDKVTIIEDALPEKDKGYYREGEGVVVRIAQSGIYPVEIKLGEIYAEEIVMYSTEELAYVPAQPKKAKPEKKAPAPKESSVPATKLSPTLKLLISNSAGVMSEVAFVDVSVELFRSYLFPEKTTPDGAVRAANIVRVDNPKWLYVAPSGSHRLIDAQGFSHYIPSGWEHLWWKVREGAPAIVR